MASKESKYPEHYRWNMAMGLLHGISFAFAMAFSEPFSLLPLFLQSFTNSRTIIGLLVSIIKSGSAIPQLFIAGKMRAMPRGKPILVVAIWVRWLAWALLAAITFLWGQEQPIIVLIAFVVLLSIFSLAGGVANVPFFNMVAKAIPVERRGHFWGMRQFWGGLLAMAGGYLVKIILSNKELPFPKNYGFLFFVTSAVLVVGYTALTLFRESDTPISVNNRKSKESLVPAALHYIKTFAPLRHVIISQIMSNALFLSLPFFVLHAKEELAFPTAWVGYFVTAQMMGGMVSNFLWARLSDRIGNVLVIKGSIVSAIAAIALALFVNVFWLYTLVFVFAGFFLNGSSIGYNNYILELGDEDLRPVFLSVQGTLMLPVYFYPFLGGILADRFGYTMIFWVSLIALVTSLVLTFELCELRKKEARCQVVVRDMLP